MPRRSGAVEIGKENSENSLSLSSSTSPNPSSKRTGRTSMEDRTEHTQAGMEGLLSMAAAAQDNSDEPQDSTAEHDEPHEPQEEGSSGAEEEAEEEAEAAGRKRSRRTRGGSASEKSKKKSKKKHRTAADLLDDDEMDDEDDVEQQQQQQEDAYEDPEDFAEGDEELQADLLLEEDDAAAAGRSRSSSSRSSRNAAIQSPLQEHHVNRPGKPAEAGIIRRVYVENFMCHRKLTVDLCRNVNFIYGQNGSGKSAVLAAIQICLGAGAKRTHRARNLKELVRKEAGSNCTGAKIRVTVLNRGDDGYQHDVYGDSITIERAISLRGGYNGYKLLDENGVERSRNKKDLDAMLDQLNIQVENPVAVLDQEEAKKFLTGKAEDKYNFFTKATELERMDRCYAEITDNIDDMAAAESRIRDSLEPKTEVVRALKHEWDQFKELEKLEDNVAMLRVNAVWAKHNELQDEAVNAQATVTKLEEKLDSRQKDLAKAEEMANVDNNEEEELKAKVAELTEEANEAEQTKNERETEFREVDGPTKKMHKELKHLEKKEKKANKNVQLTKRALQEMRDEIVAAAGNRESEARARTERMTKAERTLETAKAEEHGAKLAVDQNLKKYEEANPKFLRSREDTQNAETQYNTARHELRTLENSAGNSLAVFGDKVMAMAQKIDAAKRRNQFEGPVAGPIGHFLKLTERGKKYSGLVEAALGNDVMGRFVVMSNADRALLMRFRREIKCSPRDCGIFQLGSNRRYNVGSSPSPDVDLVSDVLNIENDLVFNCLVDNAKIDQIALAESKEISEQALLQTNGGQESIRGNVKRVLFLPSGDSWSVMRGTRQIISNEKKLNRKIGVDRTAAIEEKRREIDLFKGELDQKRRIESEIQKEAHQYKKAWNEANKRWHKLENAIQKAEETIDAIRNEDDGDDNIEANDTSELEQDVKDAEDELERIKADLEEKSAAIEDAIPAIEEAKKRLEEVTTRNDKVVAEIEEAENRLEKYAQGHLKLQSNVDKRKRKVEEMEAMLEQTRAKVDGKVGKAEEWAQKARLASFHRDQEKLSAKAKENGKDYEAPEPTDEILEAIEAPRVTKTVEYYKTKIEAGEKRIEKEKQKRALTESDPEVAFMKYKRAKDDLDEKMHQVQTINKNIDALTIDARERRKRWTRFRSHIENTTGNIFNEILNKKGSAGELHFDHHDCTLNLVVQKDAEDQMTQTADVKALSGGERSFTTLSLLLALGENLETPFRVMDEFDVFLDPVSRKIALEQLIDTAKGMEHRQFIFITPQDLSAVKTDSKLKIVKMRNPKRGGVGDPQQQTLAF